MRTVANLAIMGGAVALLVRMVSEWGDVAGRLGGADRRAVAGAVAAGLVAVLAAGCVWAAILRLAGQRVRLAWVGIYLQSQLGKYVPGAVWQYVGRAGLSRMRGVPVRVVMMSVSVEVAAAIGVAAAFSSLLLGPFAAAAIIAAFVAIAGVTWRFTPAAYGARVPRLVAAAAILYVPIWVLLSLSISLTAIGVADSSFSSSLYYAGAFALAWLVGVAAVPVPGGLGVREAVLVAMLRGRLGEVDAAAVAAASRMILTVVDGFAAALGMIALRLERDDHDAVRTPVTDARPQPTSADQ